MPREDRPPFWPDPPMGKRRRPHRQPQNHRTSCQQPKQREPDVDPGQEDARRRIAKKMSRMSADEQEDYLQLLEQRQRRSIETGQRPEQVIAEEYAKRAQAKRSPGESAHSDHRRGGKHTKKRNNCVMM